MTLLLKALPVKREGVVSTHNSFPFRINYLNCNKFFLTSCLQKKFVQNLETLLTLLTVLGKTQKIWE